MRTGEGGGADIEVGGDGGRERRDEGRGGESEGERRGERAEM